MAEKLPDESHDLAARTQRSAGWRAVETAGSEGLSFLMFVVMARLLVPEDFGLVALASSIVLSFQCLLQFGIPESLIQKATLTESNIRSAMSASLMLGIALLMLAGLLAWPLSLALGRPEFPPIFMALACVLILQSLSFPLHGLLRRALDLKSIAIRTLVATTVGGIVAIMLARQGYGPWALVAQQLTVAAIGLLMLLRVSSIRPWPFSFEWASFQPLIAVAQSFMLGQFATQSVRKLDAVVLGLFLGNHDVGIYFLVTRLIQAAQTVSQFSIGEISLAVLSRLQHDPVRMRNGIRRALRLTGFACLFFFGGLALVSPTFVPTLFGPAMADAAEPLRILALFASAGALISTCVHVLISAGGNRASVRLAVIASIVQLAAVAVAARYGMVPLVYAIGIAQLLMVVPAFALVKHQSGLSLRMLITDQIIIVTGFVLVWLLSLSVMSSAAGLTMSALSVILFVLAMALFGALIFRHDLPILLNRQQQSKAS